MDGREIITRKEAIERGLKRYFTGKPCKNGHVSDRLVSNKSCADCLDLITMEYRKKNPEVIRENRRRYRVRHPEKISSLRKERYESNKKDEYFLSNERARNRENRAYNRLIKLAEQDQETE